MLYIYTDKKFIPKDIKYIDDPIPIIHVLKIPKSDSIVNILKIVEHGDYSDETTFIDKFDRKLFNSCLSSGSSALIVACTLGLDAVVNINDLGLNTANKIIPYLDNCRIYYEQSPTMSGHNGTVYHCNDGTCTGAEELTIAMSGIDMSYFDN